MSHARYVYLPLLKISSVLKLLKLFTDCGNTIYIIYNLLANVVSLNTIGRSLCNCRVSSVEGMKSRVEGRKSRVEGRKSRVVKYARNSGVFPEI